MTHANARTTAYARRLVAERCLAGWPAARVAEQLGVSRSTVYKWIRRYRQEGCTGLKDRSSRPRSSPTRTPAATEAAILRLRATAHCGPLFLAGELGLVASTVGRVLCRHRPAAPAAIPTVRNRVMHAALELVLELELILEAFPTASARGAAPTTPSPRSTSSPPLRRNYEWVLEVDRDRGHLDCDDHL